MGSVDHITKADGLPRVHGLNRDELILEFMPDALKQKWRHVRTNPTKEEDIHSVALVALVEAVDWWLINRTDDNLGKVVCLFANRQINDYILYDHTVRCPKSQKIKPMVVSATLHDSDGQCFEDFTLAYQQVTHSMSEDTVDYNELLKRMELTYRQRTILDLRIKGYTLAEIAIVLRLSMTRVHELLDKIKTSYKRLQSTDCG